MNKEELIERNKRFVIGVIDLIDRLPKTMAFSIFSRQLLRCASSVGANYRSACRAKSTADFINKLKIVEEEADELVAIYVASIKTIKSKNLKSKI